MAEVDGPGSGLTSFIPQLNGHSWPNTADLVLYLTIGLLCILLLTRITSNKASTSGTISRNGVTTVPPVPHWIPLLGHLPNMAIDADGFVKGLRSRYASGIFALNFAGVNHNVVYSPGLATALLNQKPENADAEDVVDGMLQTVFGMPRRDMPLYQKSRAEIMACYKHLLGEPSLSGMVDKTANKIKENIQNLVTFTSSPVDEAPWERKSDIDLTKNTTGNEVVEASLLPLIRDFCAHTAAPTIIGSDFLSNFPDFFDDIWTLDRGFLLLATGLPRWLPIPILTRAHIARRNTLRRIDTFHRALDKHASGQDPGVEWRNLDNVGSLVKARLEVYRKDDWSIRARSAIEHSLMWAANANSNALVFWMINRIYSNPDLLNRLREEIAPYVKVVPPRKDLPIAEAARIERFDVEGLCTNCPLLKSCYIESLRLDTASWSLKVVKQDFVLQSREKESPPWLLRKGEYAHAAHDLHNTDPAYFASPQTWKADRHVKSDPETEKDVADMGSVRPYGGGSSMCKGRAFAFKECMAFVAAIVAMWEIEPKGGIELGWKMPRHRKATGVYGTSDDTRVWVRRREVAPQKSRDSSFV